MAEPNVPDDFMIRVVVDSLRDLPPSDPDAIKKIVSAAVKSDRLIRIQRQRRIVQYWRVGGSVAAAMALFAVGLVVGRRIQMLPSQAEVVAVASSGVTRASANTHFASLLRDGDDLAGSGGGDSRLSTFKIYVPSAREVHLVGDFNGWNPAATPLAVRGDSSGLWATDVALTPGRHTYAFVIDGVITPDPNVPSVRDPDYDVAVSALIVREP